MAYEGDEVISISSLDSRFSKIKQLLTCPICKKLLREVTTIDECLHKFCRKCITKKIRQDKLCNCPICKVDLGVFPLQKLRPDYRWQSIRNSIKFKRQQCIESGLKQKQFKEPQASEEPNGLQNVPLEDSLLVGRGQNSLVWRKEKSISSILRAEKESHRHAPRKGRRKSTRRYPNNPRRTSFSNVQPTKEKEDPHESPSNHVKLGNGEQGRKQVGIPYFETVKPSNQELSTDNEGQSTQKLEGMNVTLEPLDSQNIGVGTNSKANLGDVLQVVPCETHGNLANEDKGKNKQQTNISSDQCDESISYSVPSQTRRSIIGGRAEEKRPVLIEDLNLPAEVYLDASSSKCFRSSQIWFSLVASNNKKYYVPLPPMPPCYIMVKDPNMPASFLRRYLMKKLRLYNEDEVELSVWGQPISPNCTLKKLVDLWMQTSPRFETKPGVVGGSAKDFVMVITYGRSTILAK